MKLAFVIPWYGADVSGGAETEARKTAEALDRLAGVKVEVLTTCARDFHSDWNENARPAGLEWVNGIPVRRFPVRCRDTEAFDAVNFRLMHRLPVTPEEEVTYMREMIHSPALYDFISARGNDYTFLFIPYMFGTTCEGSAIHPDRSVIIPCLHDESYAYLSCYREMLRRVRGIAFLTNAELSLAHRLYEMRPDAPALVRAGVDTDFESRGDRFVARYGVQEFLLYVGRKEPGKNVPLLVDYFARYKRRYGGPLKLLMAGKGRVELPPDCREDILDLGFLPEQDKRDAYAATLALCQPSLNESFSIVMMEAWVAGTPALAHADCAVTREHCLEANGGLVFGDAEEFAEAVRRLEGDHALRRALGVQGRRYVLSHFTWDSVVENYLDALDGWGFPVARRSPASGPIRTTPRRTTTEAHQLVAGLRSGDAITQIAAQTRATLRSWGLVSDVFATHIHPDCRDRAFPLDQLERRCLPGQLLIYHYSIHSEASEAFLRYPGRKVLVYHNITPSDFFAGYSDLHVSLTRIGRARLPALVRAADLCLGDSRYNCEELETYGAVDCRVLPPLLDFEALARIQPDPGVLRRYGDGTPTILYVGRPVPNKRQDELIRALAHYRNAYDLSARLILVGGSDEADRYQEELHRLTEDLDLARHVVLTGAVTDEELAGYYRLADVFLSMSKHEGFGIPLLEAMTFDIPVLAYGAAGVPYTLGDAGILIREKHFDAIADTLQALLTDSDLRKQVLLGQRRRLKDFALGKVTAMFRLYLDELLEELPARTQ